MSGNKRLASMRTPAVMNIHTVASTGADDKKPFNGVLLLNNFENFLEEFSKPLNTLKNL